MMRENGLLGVFGMESRYGDGVAEVDCCNSINGGGFVTTGLECISTSSLILWESDDSTHNTQYICLNLCLSYTVSL